MQLSPHFSLAELTVSTWAAANKVSNIPTTSDEWDNIKRLATELETVRGVLHHNPMRVTSGFRNDRVNKAAGGVDNSAHRFALAADFTCPLFGNVTKVARAIADSDIQFDQLIWEYGVWVHIGFRRGSQRRQLLTKREGRGYVAGLPQ